MRLLILITLVYLGYRAMNRWLRGQMVDHNGPGRRSGGEIEDVMVQDPQCGVYFPRREALALEHDGRTLYFCSPECRDAFISSRPSG